jgi:D-sedoheptulose 7-phosphate isomerase
MEYITKQIINDLISRYPQLVACSEEIIKAFELIKSCYILRNKMLVCGNGGSAADALHIVGELMKGFILPRDLSEQEKMNISQVSSNPEHLCKGLQRSLPAIALVNETALITAYANDMFPDLVFAQQVYGYGQIGDVLLCISTSGSSKNVVYAAEVAKAKRMKVVSLTGINKGALEQISDVLISVPEKETYKIQELHLPVYHALCLALENEFFNKE